MKATRVYSIACELGEGSFWHETRNSFFWVDIYGCTLYEYNLTTTNVRSWKFPRYVTMIAGTPDPDKLLLATTGSIIRFNLHDGTSTHVVDVERDMQDHRPNDGGVDPAGRLWIGTLHNKHHTGAGNLYCVDKDLTVQLRVKELSIPNGLVWSADGSKMFHIDSPTRRVQRYAFDASTGLIVFEKTVITVPEDLGSPDGMCIDAEGMLWIAHWNGFGVYRWNPKDGKLLSTVELPVPQVSSCVFGGERRDKLFITTARENMNDDALAKYPNSGSVFMVEPGVRGCRYPVADIG